MQCKLCLSDNATALQTLSVTDLEMLYTKSHQVSIRRLFKEAELVMVECPDCGLRFFSPCVTGDEAFYNSLQHADWYYVDSKHEFEFVAGMIAPHETVLDVGSGRGAFAALIGNSGRYVGLDFSDQACEAAARDGISVRNEDVAEHCERLGPVYDAVCSFQSLEHVSDPHEFLAAMIGCVAPGGRLFIAVPSEDSFVGQAVNSPLNMPPHHVTRWTDRALESIARIFNLKCELIYHEPLQSQHQACAARTLAESILGSGGKLIDLSVPHKIRQRIGARLQLRMLDCTRTHGMFGQTVIAVYRKPIDQVASV